MLEDRASTAMTPSAEEIALQVEKLLASPPFQHSGSTRRLLAFLAQHSASYPGEPVKEIELAVSVYDLSPETFDPQLDSAVRVKVGRLRAKVADYYANYGQNDEVLLEIPKGAYCLVSSYRRGTTASAQAVPDNPAHPSGGVETTVGSAALPHLSEKRRVHWTIWLMLGVVLGGTAVWLGLHRVDRAARVPDHLSQFWRSVATNGQPVIAVFSNPRLTGVLAHGGLHYQDDAASDSAPVNLGYAGAGDVQSVHELTHIFDQLHQNLSVESGALLSWDVAKDSNLIFIGRPEQNPALDQLPRLREFYFKYNEGIVNAHPQPGEQSVYSYMPDSASDYAIVAYIPGIHPQESTLVLAGNTTWGSLGAVEFMTRDRTVAELLNRLKVAPGQKVPYFEALLKVQINDNVPVWSTILAVRAHPAGYASWEPPMPDER